jgi:mannose-1-phosphate guanylyltransferase
MKVLILAGGHGSRLWPVSTTQTPKQFQKFINDKTLLQLTFERHNFVKPSDIFVATNQIYKDIVKQQLPELPEENIIVEPSKKDSGPALCFAMWFLKNKFGDQETVSISPADHIISDNQEYAQKITLGHKLSKQHSKFSIVEVKAKSPNPNLGYAKIKDLFCETNGTQVYTLDKFIEKPDLETAKQFLKSYKYMWNTGYFIWPIGKFFLELATHAPQLNQATNNLDINNIESSYNNYPAISIDYALIEKVTPEEILIIPAELDWSDIGTWQTLHEQLADSADDNLTQGEVHIEQSSGNIVINNTDKIMTVIGVDNLSVIATDKAILVAPKADSKSLKEFINNNPHVK